MVLSMPYPGDVGDMMSLYCRITVGFSVLLSGLLLWTTPTLAQPTPGSCAKPNLLVMLDRSGSMLKNNKWTIAKNGINGIAVSNAQRLRIGLLTFANQASLDAAIPSTAQAIAQALNKINPVGDTYMLPAVTLARSHLNSVIQADTVAGRPNSILLITDGSPSDKCPVQEVAALRQLTVGTDVYDIKTYVVGFGTQVNPICLNNLATAGGTARAGSLKYYVATGQNDFNSIVANIASTSSQEVCNGLDDDCDGTVDNIKGTGTTLQQFCQKGRCSGVQQCVQGKWDACQPNPPATAETCNSRDDDCDGYVDNKPGDSKDFSLSRSCTGACGKGTQTCVSGQWGACTANTTVAEACNGKDDDCDGRTDNVPNTTLPIEQACKAGLCAGKQACSQGQWGACQPSTPAKPETCNGQDDDCDGFIDNKANTSQDQTLTQTCQTRCGSGTATCIAGRWQNCTAPQELPETCNGKDDDCDGRTDNVRNTTNALSQSCSVGRCAGRRTCSNGTFGACTPNTTPTAESCNNRDDDCDGFIDNAQGSRSHNTLKRNCKTNCGTGTETCISGSWRNCTAAPQTEVCNGKDDDCDGQIDNVFQTTRRLSQSCNVGGCAGTRVCQSGSWQACKSNTTPTVESCNNRDDDCDGFIDNQPNVRQSNSLTRTCTNSCGSGTQRCTRGSWSACQVPNTAETCNGKDDDCDGRVDNVKDTTRSITQSCTANGCAGTQACSSGSWGACNPNSSSQSNETCNGKDDDCDGKVDNVKNTNNPIERFCVTNSCEGSQTCVSGNWAVCQVKPTAVKTEVCNGKDDDCDGVIDNAKGSTSANSLTQPCKTSCGSGTETCVSGRFANCTAPQPKAEDCNGKDDDCDGSIDEDWASNLGKSCKTPCGSGVLQCNKSGRDLYCAAPNVTPEVCDGKDNDCDGSVDEDWPQKGKICSAGSGACQKAGLFQCKTDGSGVECSAKAPNNPSPEICDGIDNDCDGLIDENLKRACSQPCGQGNEVCQEGKWSACSGGNKPEPEICDNKDNDCNGVVDDNLSRPCLTACGQGTEVCQTGSWSACSAPKPETEVCDNKDNDCNGQVDDGLQRACSTDCGTGNEQCVQGKWQFCDAPKPEKEVCDGKDNDCNGQVDDGLDPRPCKGTCGEGTASCQNGQWSGCSINQPEPEVCDGKDNDCNGQTDENLERACRTVCGEGKEVCQNGQWGSCSAPAPKQETCNGQDDDCNGLIDNNVTCPNGETCVAGVCRRRCRNGECPAGERCINGVCVKQDTETIGESVEETPDSDAGELTAEDEEPIVVEKMITSEPGNTDRISGQNNPLGDSDERGTPGCGCTAAAQHVGLLWLFGVILLGLLGLRKRQKKRR